MNPTGFYSVVFPTLEEIKSKKKKEMKLALQ